MLTTNKEKYYRKTVFTGNGIKKELIQGECLDYAEDLYCEICKNLCYQPVSCLTCHSLYCKNCIDAHLKVSNNNVCPKGCNLKICDLNPILLKILKKIRVGCIHEKCNKILLYSDFEPHISSCDLAEYCCASDGCTFGGEENTVKQHIENCEEFQISCCHCNETVKRKNFPVHTIECNMRILYCHFCKTKMKKSELLSHLENCKDIAHLCVECKILTSKNIINNKEEIINYNEGKNVYLIF